MKAIWIIAKRDLKSYFSSPIAYIVIAVFTGVMGWMFFNIIQHFHTMNAQYQSFNMGKGGNLTDHVVRPLYGNLNVIILFLVPFITMRLFAEERKMHTIELLMTSPITLWQLVIGKYLSALLLVGSMLAISIIYPIVLLITGNPDFAPILTSYFGILFLFGSYIAVGILFSAATENQIVAGVLTFGANLFFWLVAWGAQSAGPIWGDILKYLSVIQHYEDFGKGVINTTDVLFYLSFIGTGLFLTHRVLDSYRWRSS